MSTITVPTTLTAISSTAFGIPVANQLNQQSAFMTFTPAGNSDTPGAGTATWVTLGNVTVPTWATQALVDYTCNGIYDTGTTSVASCVIKIGSAAGQVSKRILTPGVANQRIHMPINDLVTGLSTGSQSVTLSSTFSSGSVVRADTTSFFTVQFTFLG